MTADDIAVRPAQGIAVNSPTFAYRSYVLIVLVAVYTFNFIDRQIVGILAVPIKSELSLTDSRLGLMGGLAFALFGALSDALRMRSGVESLRYAILSGTGLYILAAMFFFYAARHLHTDWHRPGI